MRVRLQIPWRRADVPCVCDHRNHKEGQMVYLQLCFLDWSSVALIQTTYLLQGCPARSTHSQRWKWGAGRWLWCNAGTFMVQRVRLLPKLNDKLILRFQNTQEGTGNRICVGQTTVCVCVGGETATSWQPVLDWACDRKSRSKRGKCTQNKYRQIKTAQYPANSEIMRLMVCQNL